MRLCVHVLFCVCLVLWAGCCPVKSSRKLGSDLRDITYPLSQPGQWRRLLEENTNTSNQSKQEEPKATQENLKTTNGSDGDKKPVENKPEPVDAAAVTVKADKAENSDNVQKKEEPKNDKIEIKFEQNKTQPVVQKEEAKNGKPEVKDESPTSKNNTAVTTKEESKLDSAVNTEQAKASAFSQNEANKETSQNAASGETEKKDEPEGKEIKVDSVDSSKDAVHTEDAAQAENAEAKSENTLEASVEKANIEDKNDGHDVVLEKPVDGNSQAQQTASEETSNDTADGETQTTASSKEDAVQSQVEMQLQELRNRNNEFEPLDDRRRIPNDDYDIMQELADLPSKFQETAGIVADHLRPDVLKWTDTSKEYFNLANQQISESFSPLVGKEYAPFIATMVSYGVLLLPLIVVIILFEHIKALFSLQKVLLFANIYLTAYFSTLWLAAFVLGLEPMSFFYQNNLSNYLSLQLLQALGYIVYLILQTFSIITSCHSDTVIGKLTALLQWVVAMSVGLHYYVAVFHPAVASKPPHIDWKIYAVYSVAFFILCLSARIRWMKKQYIVNNSVNKRN